MSVMLGCGVEVWTALGSGSTVVVGDIVRKILARDRTVTFRGRQRYILLI